MKTPFLILFQCLILSSLGATGQFPDVIEYKGKERALLTNPLDDFFLWNYEWPDFHEIFPDGQSTACWRGYIAKWEIADGVLYLKSVKSCHSDKEVELSQIIQRRDTNRIKADWYSGILRIPDGEQLRYVHAGYASTYERDILLKIDSGKVVDEVVHDTRPWFLKDFLSETYVPKVPFEDIDIEQVLDTIFELAVVYSREEEHAEEMIKGLNIKYEISQNLRGNKVNLDETNISLWGVLQKSAESVGGRVKIEPASGQLVIKILSANKSGDDNSE
ncbi:hypothetical protein [Coraliomargarita akajimensis]|uniref:Uncharacterized protein n=1 Tax=Coraliomargarita akajimensis (strain DSM 45221 / IAM 15411 / JCM 23193 / KCTC 12865 / 04OKA010-24) TaxID=583355 RepID=D5EMB4_CORAD|nr:hypothetical protein [Coraliomargarita akajimensis]ADE53320.1 hypothetical protein Caka_0294 [Coraliomargarita akajimensis DSM 45221]